MSNRGIGRILIKIYKLSVRLWSNNLRENAFRKNNKKKTKNYKTKNKGKFMRYNTRAHKKCKKSTTK